MSTETSQPLQEENVISGYYEDFKQTQAEIFSMEGKKVRKCLFWVAGLLFGSDLLAYLMLDYYSLDLILASMIVPAIFIGLGFLAQKQPMLASVLAMIVFAGIIILTLVVYGRVGAITGLIVKAFIIYFLIASYQSAKVAEQARRDGR
jgi:hypothetical protein